MSSKNGEGHSRKVTIDSDTAQGQRIQSDIVALAQAVDFTEAELFAVRLAVEEALTNAIKHGNGSDPDKKVRIEYGLNETRDQMRIHIEDEGPGFDPDDVPDPTDPEFLERPCGRGIMLIRHYARGRVEFNEKGNALTMEIHRGEYDEAFEEEK